MFIKMKKKSNFENLKEYFEKTPKETIKKDWEATKKLNDAGPNIEDFQKVFQILNGLNLKNKK